MRQIQPLTMRDQLLTRALARFITPSGTSSGINLEGRFSLKMVCRVSIGSIFDNPLSMMSVLTHSLQDLGGLPQPLLSARGSITVWMYPVA